MSQRLIVRLLSLVTVPAVLVLGVPVAGYAAPRAAVATSCGTGGVFCAGAATGDITPPVTAPQWAYTLRNCATATAVEIGGHAQDPQNHVEEGAAFLLGGGPSCVANKAAPDTEAYAKTWPPSQGTFGRLQADAYVLDDGKGQRVAIVQADLGGIPGELDTYVAQHLAAEGIDRAHLTISATHTHGSVGGMWQGIGYSALGGDEYDPRIFSAVATGLIDTIKRAAAQLAPARLAVGVGQITDANHNRRGDAHALNPEHETQNAYRFVAIRVDRTDGVPLGLISNFSNHGIIGETFNYYLNGDQAAATTRSVSAAIRAAAEVDGVRFPAGWQVVDALTNGAQGDITPEADNGGWDYTAYGYDNSNDGSPPFGQFARMENSGLRQTPEAVRLWRALGSQLTSDVTLDARMDFVCMCGQAVPDDPYDPYDNAAGDPVNDDPAYHGTSREAILGTGDGTSAPQTLFPSHHLEKPEIVGGPGVSPHTARVQLLRINDVGLVSVPGEATIQMGRRIERSVKAAAGGLFKDVYVVGLANDYTSYEATTQEYEAYQYEGSFSLFGQQTGNLLKDRFVYLARRMAAGQQVDACDMSAPRYCLEPPDTSALAVAPTATAPDLLAGTPEVQPSDVARFTGTRFTWIGGGPSAEWSQNHPMVALQRQNGALWETVATDQDSVLPVHYDKCESENHWTAFTDPTVDAAPGRYRFHVTGRQAVAPGTVTPYVLDSATFEVTPFRSVGIVALGTGTYAVANPAPDPLANFRYRTRANEMASVQGGGPTFALAAGQTRVIPPGGITDPYGNTNSQTITVSDAGVQLSPDAPAPTRASPPLVCATAAAPAAVVAEVPWTPALLLVAVATLGVGIHRDRRRRA